MNKDRRERLNGICEQLEALASELEEVKSEEEQYMDSMPENMQGGEKYEAAEIAVIELENAINYINDAVTAIIGVTDN